MARCSSLLLSLLLDSPLPARPPARACGLSALEARKNQLELCTSEFVRSCDGAGGGGGRGGCAEIELRLDGVFVWKEARDDLARGVRLVSMLFAK